MELEVRDVPSGPGHTLNTEKKVNKCNPRLKWDTYIIQYEKLEGTFLCLNIEKANERITEPKNPINTSPAPGLDEALVR